MIDYDNPHALGSYVGDLIAKFDASEDATRKARESAERDVDYYDNKQWTDEEVRKLKARGQPAVARNLIKPRVDFLRGLEKSRRTDPVALPRTPAHEAEAHAVTDALRYIDDATNYDQHRSAVWRDLLLAGWGGVEITARQNARGEYDVVIERTPWDRMFWDPASSREDFGDASYLGVVVWMDRPQALAIYGEDAAAVFDETVANWSVGNTYDDKPRQERWVDSKRQRVRVVQMYHQAPDGAWYLCEFTRGGVLKAGPSPWLDEDGIAQHPYQWRSLHVDRDNNRYGFVRVMIDPQDEVNKRASKFLHLVSVRQTFGTQGAVDGETPEIRKQLARPDGHIEMAPGRKFGEDFGIIPTGDMATGQFQLLQQSIQDIQSVGPSQALMGQAGASQSGRAIIAQQQGGLVANDPVLDVLRDLDRGVFRDAWDRVRQFWTGEKWIRVTDEFDNSQRWVPINRPVMDAFGNVTVENQIAALDVDIIISDAPDVPSMQGEEFAKLTQLANAGIVFPPEVYIQASALRDKAKLVQILQQQQQQGPPPDVVEMQKRGAEAELAEKQASALDKSASARKKMAEADTLEVNAAQARRQAAAIAALPIM